MKTETTREEETLMRERGVGGQSKPRRCRPSLGLQLATDESPAADSPTATRLQVPPPAARSPFKRRVWASCAISDRDDAPATRSLSPDSAAPVLARIVFHNAGEVRQRR